MYELEKPTMDFIVEKFLELVRGHTYFRIRTISNDILSNEYNIQFQGHPEATYIFATFRRGISKRLSQIAGALKKHGYIIKHNQRSWKVIKPLDLGVVDVRDMMKKSNKKRSE